MRRCYGLRSRAKETRLPGRVGCNGFLAYARRTGGEATTNRRATRRTRKSLTSCAIPTRRRTRQLNRLDSFRKIFFQQVQQDREVHRFGYKTRATRHRYHHLNIIHVVSRKSYYRNIAHRNILFDLSCRAEAVDDWKREVHQDDVWLGRDGQINRLSAVGSLDYFVAFDFQKLG